MTLAVQQFRISPAAAPGSRRWFAAFPVALGFSNPNCSPPTLVVDRNVAAAKQLADRLSQRGFEADVANDCRAAQAAVRAKYYRSLILVIDLGGAIGWECVGLLRKRALRSWIIVVTSFQHKDTQDQVFRVGGDALLVAPLAFEELIARLSAFSLRSRPW